MHTLEQKIIEWFEENEGRPQIWSAFSKTDLYPSVVSETNFIIRTIKPQHRLWIYLTNWQKDTTCKWCNTPVNWQGGKNCPKKYCSDKCAIKGNLFWKSRTNLERYGSASPGSSIEVRNKMEETVIEKFGVKNVSQSKTIKQKKKNTSIKNYGVDSFGKTEEGRQLSRNRQNAYWKKVYDKKDFTSDGMDKKTYDHRARQYALTQYTRNKEWFDPEDKQGKEFHIDHIYSKMDGFINDVPINIISDISNLRLISAVENMSKNKRSDKTLEQLYEDYTKQNML